MKTEIETRLEIAEEHLAQIEVELARAMRIIDKKNKIIEEKEKELEG